MIRKKIYYPQYDGPVQGYVMNFLRSNYWRVAATMEFEDCTQEAYSVFLVVASKYGPTDTPQHFMSLFKISWINHFNDLSTKDSKIRKMLTAGYETAEDGQRFDSLLDNMIGEVDTSGHLYQMIMKAPDDIRVVLAFIVNGPDYLVEIVCDAWSGSTRKRKKGNELLCRLLGFSKATDVFGALVKYFGV